MRDLRVDTVPSLTPGHHVKGIVNEANYLLVITTIEVKYMDKEILNRLLATHIKPKSRYASQVRSLHKKKKTKTK